MKDLILKLLLVNPVNVAKNKTNHCDHKYTDKYLYIFFSEQPSDQWRLFIKVIVFMLQTVQLAYDICYSWEIAADRSLDSFNYFVFAISSRWEKVKRKSRMFIITPGLSGRKSLLDELRRSDGNHDQAASKALHPVCFDRVPPGPATCCQVGSPGRILIIRQRGKRFTTDSILR